MRRDRMASAAMAATLLLGGGSLAACDNEDQKDVQEVGDEAEKDLDNLDKDGKDD